MYVWNGNIVISLPINRFGHPTPSIKMSSARRLIPLLDRVLVERVVAAVKSPGGVLLPESALPKVRGAMQDAS